MLRLALIFFLVSLVAGLLSYGGIAQVAVGLITLIFWIGLVFFILSVTAHIVRRA